METKNNNNKMNKFSVALGLFDYINPIFYSITSITLATNMAKLMNKPLFIMFTIGVVLSLIFGFSIPTVKLLVGLGKIPFKLPVKFVFYVNSGILLSGISLFSYIFNLKQIIAILLLSFILAILALIYTKTKKFNTVAVLIGSFGYILIYTSLITLAIRKVLILPIVLYAIAICLFVFLCLIGIKANLKKARIHWVIEISNVICQMLVAIATIMVFH